MRIEDKYNDMPVKRRLYIGICFRAETSLENLSNVREFLDGVMQTFGVQVKKENEDECNLMCEEETLASEVNSHKGLDSPGKRIYTYSSHYKRIENVVYDNLISALHKLI